MDLDSHRVDTPAAAGGQGPPGLPISGRKLSRRRNRVPRRLLARLALELQAGTACPYGLTAKQACEVTGITAGELATAKRRRAKKNGNGGNGKQHRLFYRRSPSDADLDAAVTQYGPRLMEAMDRATRPPRCQRTSDMFPITR